MPAPVRVPEFEPPLADPASIGGEEGKLDVNFCMNPICGNFGLSRRLTKNKNQSYKINRDYNILRMTCLECGMGRRIYSNQAVDAMFLYVLKNTLLHEYCPIPECSNYRVNFYEHYPDRYSKHGLNPENSIYSAHCKGSIGQDRCGKNFAVGTPWRQHEEKKSEYSRYISDLPLFMRMVCNNTSPSNLLEQLDCLEEHYYRLMGNLSAMCNFLSGRHFMKLQRQCDRHSDWDKGLRLYSDIAELPILISAKGQRTKPLRYIVTVTNFNNSYVVLAATPAFIKDSEQETLHNYLHFGPGESEALKWECHRDHAHLQWSGVPLRSDSPPLKSEKEESEKEESDKKKSEKDLHFPVVGLKGFFAVAGYAAFGHFLVLRKMLSRIDRVIHYVDNEDVLRMASVAAFSDRIREGRCDVVAVKTEDGNSSNAAENRYAANLNALKGNEASENSDKMENKKMKKIGKKKMKEMRKNALLKSIEEKEGCIQEAAENYKRIRATLPRNKCFPNEKACVCWPLLSAKRESHSRDDNVLDLWVKDPLPPKHEIGRYFLWLTRRCDDDPSFEHEHELALYLSGKHQPVDTFLASLRQVMSTAARPPMIASRNKLSGYVSSARTPAPPIFELSLQRFYWNFMRRRRTSGTLEQRHISRAHYLGIHEKTVEEVTNAPNYRKEVFEWAEEITRWLSVKPQ